jgi:cobalt-zinc-cadmium efflux system protein
MAHNHPHHDDDHHHEHGGGSNPKNWNKAFILGIFLNFCFVVVEAIYGYLAHSLSLIADAGHNLSDVLGLGLAFGAHFLAQKKPSQQFTYGYKSSTILASLANSIVLLVAVGGILVESLQRLRAPEMIGTNTVMVVALVGIFINGLTAMLFFSGREKDLNIRGAFLHMLADALISFGVVVSAFLISKTQWLWIDPTVSVIIALVIVWSTWKLLKESLSMALGGVPAHIEISEVREFLEKSPGVTHVHDLHVWALSTTDVALTAHLVIPQGSNDGEFLKKLISSLKKEFQIQHATIQVEFRSPQDPCCSLEK